MIYIYGIRVVLSVFYTFWRSYRGGETFPGSNSLWAKLPGAKPSLGEKVFGRNYRGRNLPWAKQSLGETTGGETVVGRNSRWAKMFWAKLYWAKHGWAKLYWAKLPVTEHLFIFYMTRGNF